MKVSIAHGLAGLPAAPTPQYPEGAPSRSVLRHGTMHVRVFSPVTNLNAQDRQVPHEQDELYLIHAGSGQFTIDGETMPVQAGDTLFVAAGQHHHFSGLSADFVTWVVFYGPTGGEKGSLSLD
jgi:mannose-6-phosphate isomerase-like protein (cupin superfamily)